MGMSHRNASTWILVYVVFFGSGFLFVVAFFSQEECGKTSHTYFGDSGVKGSGKVVGLAAEHRGAWVIIDLGMTLKAEENRSTFCNN